MNAIEMYREEKAKRANVVRFSQAGRPLCQYCHQHEAQYTGYRRKSDNSKQMRKFQDKYECGVCHHVRLFKVKPPVWLNRRKDDTDLNY